MYGEVSHNKALTVEPDIISHYLRNGHFVIIMNLVGEEKQGEMPSVLSQVIALFASASRQLHYLNDQKIVQWSLCF